MEASQPNHCEGEPTINPWRFTSQGTVYCIKVCACGGQAEYVEVEAMKQVEESGE